MRKNFVDLTGKVFEMLTVIEYDAETSKSKRRAYWICECECGTRKSIRATDLTKIISCGCYKRNNLIGKRFGKLVVLDRAENDASGHTRWLCQCDCGNQKVVSGASLMKGHTQSCGCLTQSIGEKNIQELLDLANISYIKEYKFFDLGKYRFDFYLPTLNRLIEFDGRQHYMENSFDGDLSGIQQRDKIKNDFAIQNRIDLVRIPYWERDKINIEMILGNKYLVNK
jgi:hypothetical protein